MTKEDDFKSLVGKTSDLLHTVFEYTDTISAVHEAPQQEQHKLSPGNIFSSFSIDRAGDSYVLCHSRTVADPCLWNQGQRRFQKAGRGNIYLLGPPDIFEGKVIKKL